MTDEPNPPEPRPTTRRDVLLGSAALLTATTAPAAPPAAPIQALRIHYPKMKDVIKKWKFVTMGIVTIPDVVYVTGTVTKTGGKPVPATKSRVRKITRNRRQWALSFAVDDKENGDGEYTLSVTGYYSDNTPTKPPKERKFTVAKENRVASIEIDWPASSDDITTGFVPYGVCATGFYVRWATMSTPGLPDPIEPVTIYNDWPDYYIEFDLPDAITGPYTLEIYGPTGTNPVVSRGQLTVVDPGD